MNEQTVQYHSPMGLAGVELLSCAHVGMDFPYHVHDTLTIWVNDIGCEYFRFKGCTTVLDRTGFGVVNAGEVHANGSVASSARLLQTFYLDTELCSSLFECTIPILQDGLYTDTYMHSQLVRLHGSLFLCADMLESQSLFVAVFAGLLERHGGLAPLRSLHEPWRVTRIRDRLHANIADAPSLQSLAELADCSPQHVMRLFRTHTGVPPHMYLACLRVAQVKRLLKEGSSVADVAFACGFSDQSHCTRWFRRLAGITPAAYRQAVCP